MFLNHFLAVELEHLQVDTRLTRGYGAGENNKWRRLFSEKRQQEMMKAKVCAQLDIYLPLLGRLFLGAAVILQRHRLWLCLQITFHYWKEFSDVTKGTDGPYWDAGATKRNNSLQKESLRNIQEATVIQHEKYEKVYVGSGCVWIRTAWWYEVYDGRFLRGIPQVI